jgi:hypothetical protein
VKNNSQTIPLGQRFIMASTGSTGSTPLAAEPLPTRGTLRANGHYDFENAQRLSKFIPDSVFLPGAYNSIDIEAAWANWVTSKKPAPVVAAPKEVADVPVVDDYRYAAVVGAELAAARDLITGHRRELLGTSFSDVTQELLKGLAVARGRNYPINLVKDMVFCVFLTFGVARNWVITYNSMAASSVLKTFEIKGRGASDGASWTATSDMNSTAAHLIGQLVAECAPRDTFLGQVVAQKGTYFRPRPESEIDFAGEGEEKGYMELTFEASKTVTDADRAALQKWKEAGAVLNMAVAEMFGMSGVNLQSALAFADKMQAKYF